MENKNSNELLTGTVQHYQARNLELKRLIAELKGEVRYWKQQSQK